MVHAEGQYSKEQRKADLKEEHDLVKAQEQDVKELMAARDAANKAWEKSTMEAIEFNSKAVDTFLKKQEEAARQEESTKAAAAAVGVHCELHLILPQLPLKKSSKMRFETTT